MAIGDSSTEGLEDPDGLGGYRGWADRLAQQIADAQEPVLEYANLAIRGLRLNVIRRTQFDPGLALGPDLMTIFGGVNDVIGMRCDFTALRADYREMFAAARDAGVTVLTFTMPDPAAVNPLGRHLRDRMFALNEIVRSEAEVTGALVMDFERFPITQDPRLWFEDRLHGNALGHKLVAAALAWRLGVDGADDSWQQPALGPFAKPRPRQQVRGDMDWAVHYLAPWLGKGIRKIPHGLGVEPKRPEPTALPKSSSQGQESRSA